MKEQAQALHGLGRSHRSAGRLTEAQECFQEALRLREAVGYQRGAELTRLLLAEVAMARGRPESAVPELESAHRSLMSLGDPYEAARALAFLGQARTALGRFDAAAQALEEAAGLFRAAGSAYWEARVLELSGQLAEARTPRSRHWPATGSPSPAISRSERPTVTVSARRCGGWQRRRAEPSRLGGLG